MKKTPIEALQFQIKTNEYFIQRIHLRQGFAQDVPDSKFNEMEESCRENIREFEAAIVLLTDRITPEEKANLNKLYSQLWTNSYYDPQSSEIKEFCKPLADICTELNTTMKFKL